MNKNKYLVYCIMQPETGTEGFGHYILYNICEGDNYEEALKDYCIKNNLSIDNFNKTDDPSIYNNYCDYHFIKLPYRKEGILNKLKIVEE